MLQTRQFLGIAILGLCGCLISTEALAQTTERVSVATGGGQLSYFNQYPSVSADGRFVAFAAGHVVVRDRQAGTTEWVSLSSDGFHQNGQSSDPWVSANGRFVAFESVATNLVAGDTNGQMDVFVRDLQALTTQRVSISSGGAQGNLASDNPSISGDGRFVAFESVATNLVPGDTASEPDIFVHDRWTGTTERVNVGPGGLQTDDHSSNASISADGRFVVFESHARNLIPGDGNGETDIFVHDRRTRTTERASVGDGGLEAKDSSDNASISADGRFVAFRSAASNIFDGDNNNARDVFVRDRQADTTERVSVATGGAQSNDGATFFVSISGDGRFVAWSSRAISGSGCASTFPADGGPCMTRPRRRSRWGTSTATARTSSSPISAPPACGRAGRTATG